MNTRIENTAIVSTSIGKLMMLVVAVTTVLIPGWALSDDSGQQLASLVQVSEKLMSEDYRSSVKKIVLLPGTAPATGAVTGSYEKETLGLLDGVDKGKGFGTINKDVGGIPINFPIRVLTVPGAIIGGLIGATTREIQDLRDALTARLVEAANSTLSNDALATDVFWRLREVPNLEAKIFALTTPIPQETEAILYVSFTDSTIDVQKNEAILTMSASATLHRISDGVRLYEHQVQYQDRDTLKNWTDNESAAWTDFANYARHYLGRELSAQIYERVKVESELMPRETDTVAKIKKNDWQGISKISTPTLAWEHTLPDSESQIDWAKTIGMSDISYELEIYDKHQLVYAARKIPEPRFALDIELEACKSYRWSVRPSYRIDGAVRYGKWMRSNPDAANGNDGQAAAEAAAYIYDFASLEIKCGRR